MDTIIDEINLEGTIFSDLNSENTKFFDLKFNKSFPMKYRSYDKTKDIAGYLSFEKLGIG